MPWYGHNFEDAIVLSERLVKDDVYSSIHIQELELHVRDTKRGQEEITREIPNVSEEALLDLDERGIVRIGAHVKPGDILVGKITPKGETELSPEEKLLTAIFGEKAKDVKDSSLKVPPGMEGVVIDVKIFSRIEDQVVEKDRGERIGEVRRLEGDEKIRVNEVRDCELIEAARWTDHRAGAEVGHRRRGHSRRHQGDGGVASRHEALVDRSQDAARREQARRTSAFVRSSTRRTKRRRSIEEKAEERIDRILQPDELPPGVIQLVKVYLAEKRKVSVGDKMAGRHGNKGIVARVVPEEDMPFLPDGRPVDIVLNPLGVPSRMNVGQILETHLGWVAKILGFYAKTPVFQGANEREIGLLLKMSGVLWAGQALALRRRFRRSRQGHYQFHADIKPDRTREDERFERLEEATINDLGGRAMSQQTRDIYHSIRDFLASAAKELAEREQSATKPDRVPHGLGRRRNAAGVEARGVQGGAQAAREAPGDGAGRYVERSGAAGARRHAWQEVRSGRRCGGGGADAARWAHAVRQGASARRPQRRGSSSPVTVGEIYMLKLSHLVDDKIHARSIGPYSLVTQQPLAGKAQFGGQRFGEMEVWALEAYGAAHVLQEILTVKSDDVNGRSRVYEAIVKGQNLPEPGIPESFNVLVKELQALGIGHDGPERGRVLGNRHRHRHVGQRQWERGVIDD